jgi:hypothetical protein
MGFWGDLWNGIKSVASNVYNVVRKPIDFVANAGQHLKKIPLVGGALSTLLTPLTSAASVAQSGLNTARDIASVGSSLGLQKGGIVPPMKKVYQA